MKQRIDELKEQINYHADRYYNMDAPEISDYEYDQLMQELKKIEAENPELVTPDSPTQKVGGSAKREAGILVKHRVPMLSLQDVFSKEDVIQFVEDMRQQLQEPEFVVETKIDGLSMALRYTDGVLTTAITRGDGVTQGEDKKVLLALSGGVDSSVVAALLIKAIGKQLVCVHVNHGLMRKGESESVVEVFKNQLDANLIYVDASERFLGKLENVADPEKKRKIIGTEFIRVFEEEARKLEGIDYLAQGTIYPDIVESGTKTAKMVKSHHNVGGLPEDLGFALVEPLRQLFKDEVRACGLELGLPDEMVFRQPFPGPGLGVRCLGAITKERLEAVREADAILREEFHNAGLDKKVWQYFTVVPDFKSVGVRDNARCFEYPVILRAVNTVDAMTATIEQIDWPVLLKITDRILKEVKNVNRVCYDLSPKPTATIEWE